jgi:hypothetical protein
MNSDEKITAIETQIDKLNAELAQTRERIKVLKRKTGTNLSQADYEQLEKAAAGSYSTLDRSGNSVVKENGYLTDEEALILINDEFGFEVSRIKILREAEIDVTKEGARYVELIKVPRRPVYESTDWNYIRFNVRGCAAEWQYEMVNAQLFEVNT